MPQPRDLTGSIYKSKKLKSSVTSPRLPVELTQEADNRMRVRRLGFSSFAFAVALFIVIALLGQFALMSLFRWL